MTIDMPSTAPPRVKRWTKREYNDLVEHGFLREQRVYLFRGELIEMPPMGGLHARGISGVANWLYATFRPAFEIRIQMPFDTPGESMPEPDAALLTQQQFSRFRHPDSAMLVIEVSDSSLDYDHEKAVEYAAAKIPECWILDVIARKLEIYRGPIADVSSSSGYRYEMHETFTVDDTVSVLGHPESIITVQKLLGIF